MAQLPASSDLQTDAFSTRSTPSPASGGLSADTKKRAAISAAVLLLAGGAALAFMPKGNPDELESDELPGNVPNESAAPITIPPKAEVANDVNDAMPFATAFSTARDEVGLGGVFVWHNKAYNTFLKEEWTSLSLQQRQEYAEHVLGMEVPVTVHQHVAHTTDEVSPSVGQTTTQSVDPTLIEGVIGERRVMGIDQDNDGIIDVLVIEGEDGYSYRVADMAGDEGLDTLYVYDAIKDDYVLVAKLDQPVVISNDDFSANLEDAMSKEVVDTIIAEPSADSFLPNETPTEAEMEADSAEAEAMLDEDHKVDGYGDTYVNNANVSDMDDH